MPTTEIEIENDLKIAKNNWLFLLQSTVQL